MLYRARLSIVGRPRRVALLRILTIAMRIFPMGARRSGRAAVSAGTRDLDAALRLRQILPRV
jgi:hypothetical protein